MDNIRYIFKSLLAHELGHGYFQLKYPFEMGLKQGDRQDGLMDYANGTEFNKYQWDIMHDPGIVTGLFESDTSGQYAVATHYAITYSLLKKNGITDAIAKRISYYASVYADYLDPKSPYLRGNKFLAAFKANVEGEDMNMNETIYTASHKRTENSQNTEYIDKNGGVIIHGMLAWWEGDYEEIDIDKITKYLACENHDRSTLDIIKQCEQCKTRLKVFTSKSNKTKNMQTAIDRALKSITQVQELDSTTHKIEGAWTVINYYATNHKQFQNLSEEDMAKIGLALHTIQDCAVHQGRRWDMNVESKVKGLKMVIRDNHPDLGCTFSNNSKKAKEDTQEAIDIIKGNKPIKQ